MHKLFLAIAIALLFSACGSKSAFDDVVYESDKTMESLRFNSGGTVTEMNAGVKIGEFAYKIDGDKIKIDGVDTPFTLKKDGSIDGGVMHGNFIKK